MRRSVRLAFGCLTLILALAADTAITWRLATARRIQAASAPACVEAQEDPMDVFRLEREQLRAKQEAQLNDLIHDAGSDAQIVADARRQLLDILSRSQAECTLEGILRNRGFGEVLASVSAGSANVLVRRKALTAGETAVILDLVMRETGLTGGNVKIIPVK